MCGRYALTTPRTAVAEHFSAGLSEAAEAGFGNAGPNWNVCPTLAVPVVRRGEAGRELVPMRWGFVPRWYKALNGGPLLINARSETIARKPAYGAAARARRCLIPADGFYEWLRVGKAKQPFWVHPSGPDETIVAFAGVWETWRGPDGETVDACAIVTCQAAPPLAAIHHREPVTIRAGDEALWLGEAGHGAATLMHAAPEGFWTLRKVAPTVNSNRAEGPELIEPWDG